MKCRRNVEESLRRKSSKKVFERLLFCAVAQSILDVSGSSNSFEFLSQDLLHNLLILLTYPLNELVVVDQAIVIRIRLLQENVHNMRREEPQNFSKPLFSFKILFKIL